MNQQHKTLPIVLGEGIDKHSEQRFAQATYEPDESALREQQFHSASIEIR